MPEVVVVRNPISGSGRGARAFEALCDRLEAGGCTVRMRVTESAGHGARIAREEAEGVADVVIAAGGDGTVNEIAGGLLAAGGDTALGVFPRGTSNLVARALGIPRDPLGAADVILGGAALRIDAAACGDRLFLACASAGWDADVVARLTARRRGNIGFHSYAAPILGSLLRYGAPGLRVTDAEGRTVDGFGALVLNCAPYAAFFRPAPDATPTDGLLDAVVFHTAGRLRRALLVPRWAVRAWRGTLPRDRAVTVLRSTRFVIESDAPVPVQIDGDVGGTTPADMLVRPAALRVMAPAGA